MGEGAPHARVGVFALLLLAAVPILFVALGANSIWDANEAFYVDTPRQMIARGDYVTPMFNGAERLNKPVLSYWIVAGLYHLFGVSVTTERLGIALGVLGIAAAAFLLGRALRNTTTGVLSALIILTSPRVVMWGRRIFIDIYITMFMALALACLVLAHRYPERRRRWLVLMYMAIGLGVLTKGPIALVFPVLVWAVWATVERRWSDIRHLHVTTGALVVLAIVVPWYVALFFRHGWGPVTGFFVGENLDRFTTSMQPDNRSAMFYLPVLLTDLFPWAPLVLVPLAGVWRAASRDVPNVSLRRLLWIWIVAIVAAFSLSQTKQDLYIFPVIPAVAALVADALVGSGFAQRHRGLRLSLMVVAGLSAVAGVLVVRFFGWGGYYDLAGARVMGAVLTSGAVIVAVLLLLGRHRAAVAALGATFVVFNYVFVLWTLPAVERLKPVVPLANEFLARAAPTAQLGAYNFMLPSLVFYAGRPVTVIDSPEAARAFYQDSRGAWAIMDRGTFEALRRDVPRVCVAAERPRLDPKFNDVMNGHPPADVLLVTNQMEECGSTGPGLTR